MESVHRQFIGSSRFRLPAALDSESSLSKKQQVLSKVARAKESGLRFHLFLKR